MSDRIKLLTDNRYGPCDHRTQHGPFEPISGVSTAAFGFLGDYLIGFTDIVRGTVSRSDGPPLRGHYTATCLGDVHAEDGNPKTEENKKESEGRPLGTSRSIKGLTRIASATAKLPMDLTLAVAEGLHNAPKIYGDRTVRQMPKVTGMGSGVKAAGKVRELAS